MRQQERGIRNSAAAFAAAAAAALLLTLYIGETLLLVNATLILF